MMRTGRFFDLNQLLAIWIEPWVVGDWLKNMAASSPIGRHGKQPPRAYSI